MGLFGQKEEKPAGYCGNSSPDDGYLKQLFCGASEYVGGIVEDVTTAGAETVQTATKEAGETGRKIANPLNAVGLGIGLGGGGTVAVVGIGIAAVEAVDWLVFDGAGTMGLFRMIAGRKRR